MNNNSIFNFNQRDIKINNIFLRRKNKIIFQNDKIGDFNADNKERIENALRNDRYLTEANYDIKVKECQLLHCTLTVNECNVEFENGKICNNKTVNDSMFMERLKKVMERENKSIQEKLVLPLTFNENITSLGYCLNIELLETLTYFTIKDFENFSRYLVSQLRQIHGKGMKYKPKYPAFPLVTIKKDVVYNTYYQWFHQLISASNYDNNLIPIYYQKNVNMAVPKKAGIKAISLGDEEEFRDVIKNLMNSPKTFTNIKISDIYTFIHEFLDFLKDIPETFTNLENLTYIVIGILNYLYQNYFRNNENDQSYRNRVLDKIYEKFDHFDMNMDQILVVTLLFAGNKNYDVNNFNCSWNFPYKGVDIILKYLNKLESQTRYRKLLENKYFWVRFGEAINIKEYKAEYLELTNELLDLQKIMQFNKIFLRKHRKMIIERSTMDNIDTLYRKNIEEDIKNTEILRDLNIKVKKCNLLSCVLTYNNKDLIYEDGIILNPKEIEDDYYLKTELADLMDYHTEIIRKKLVLPMTFVNRAYTRKLCLDIDFIKKIAAYSDYELEVFEYIFNNSIGTFTTGNRRREEPVTLDYVYSYYCKWLYLLESNGYDPEKIPSTYKENFEDYVRYEEVNTSIKYKVIQAVEEISEFYQMMNKLINSPEAISEEDIKNIELFITYEKNHFSYFPKTITNKENLANIINMIINYYDGHPPLEFIIPKFNSINDVLRLALVRSGHDASELGKSCRFKSFGNHERRLFMQLMNHCKNRDEDIVKYKNIWVRFCEKIHPIKYRNIYPDLVNDLLGNYNVLGHPKNKDIRKEYRLYQDLLTINENLEKFKREALQFIENNLITKDPNSPRNKKRNSYLPIEIKCLIINADEHQRILLKFKTIKNISEESKSFISHYLSELSGIAYTDILNYMIPQFLNNNRCTEWDNSKSQYKIKKNYEDVHHSLSQLLTNYLDTMIPLLDKDFVHRRIQELEPLLTQLQKQNQQYKHDHQPFNSKYIELVENEKMNEAVKLLSRKPGIFVRHLNELLTKGGDERLILEYFEKVAQKTSIKVLLSVKGYFQNRHKRADHRAFLIIGSGSTGNNRKRRTPVHTSIYYTDKKLREPLSEDLCERIVQITDETLKLYFSSKSPMKGIYIHPDFEKILIPMDMRRKSDGLENYSKGSRFKLSYKNISEEEKTVMVDALKTKLEDLEKKERQCHIEKKELEVGVMNAELCPNYKARNKLMNKYYQKKREHANLVNKVKEVRTKLEEKENCPTGETYNIVRFFVSRYVKLYIEVYDADFQFKTILTYYDNQLIDDHNEYDIYFGESQQHQCYYADIDIQNILEHHGKYIIVSVGSTGTDAKFGWLERPYLNAKESFDPDMISQCISLKYSSNACPVLLDCENKELIWIDYILPFYSFMEEFIHKYSRYHIMHKRLETMNEEERQRTYPEETRESITNLYNEAMESNHHIKKALLCYYLNPMRISITSLLELHLEARNGNRLESEDELQEGDIAFVSTLPFAKRENVEYIDSNDLEVILSDYMN